ncbi:MAG TPA: MFS transporter [Candidatus Dormibacteraeota bacterium]|jgi:MFS family permease
MVASQPRWGRPLLLGTAAAGLLLAALDAYVVVTLLPAMLYDLDLSVDRIEQATPIVSGFLAGYIVVLPLLGLASDVHGRAPVYLGALAIFAAGSVLTATAGYTGEPPYGLIGLPWLVAGRVLQGLGGGATVPVALALAADLFPAGRRTAAIGAVAAVQETGSVLGPLYGAGLAAAAANLGGWRAVFWLNLPLAALCAAGFLVATRQTGIGTAPRGQAQARPAPADWLGAILLGAGLALLVVALYPDDPRNDPVGRYFVPAGVGALAALAAWAYRQVAVLSPVIPRELLRSRQFLGSSFANLLVGGGLMVALVDIPIMGRGVFNLDQLGSALLLARFMIAVPVGAVAGGFLAARFAGRWTAVLGLAAAAAGFLLLSRWEADELSRHLGPLREADLVLVLTGLGFGIVIAPLAAAVLDVARAERHGLAASLVVLVRTLGMLVGLSALSAYGLHRFYGLFNQGPPLRLIPGSPDFAVQKAAFDARVTSALVAEYHGIFLIAAGLCVVAGLVAVLTLSARLTAGRTTVSR